MRLIDADALDFLAWKDGEHGTTFDEGVLWVLSKIDEQPTIESERHWIPCSERLPEKDGDYIVTFEKGYASDYSLDPIGIAPFEVDCEGFGFWQEQFDMHTLGSLGSDWVDINVIAWMPLPECYQEDI